MRPKSSRGTLSLNTVPHPAPIHDSIVCVQSSQIAELLTSYIVGLELPPGIYDQLGVYLEMLLRWNARTNLTGIRDPEQIVTRHFGESLFAAGVLFGTQPPSTPF